MPGLPSGLRSPSSGEPAGMTAVGLPVPNGQSAIAPLPPAQFAVATAPQLSSVVPGSGQLVKGTTSYAG